MTTKTPHIEDVVFGAGYRIRTALELICQVTAEECDGQASKEDVLCAAEALLIEANNIIKSAAPDCAAPLAQAAE